MLLWFEWSSYVMIWMKSLDRYVDFVVDCSFQSVGLHIIEQDIHCIRRVFCRTHYRTHNCSEISVFWNFIFWYSLLISFFVKRMIFYLSIEVRRFPLNCWFNQWSNDRIYQWFYYRFFFLQPHSPKVIKQSIIGRRFRDSITDWRNCKMKSAEPQLL